MSAKPSRRALKITSAAIVAVFIVIIAAGLIKERLSGPPPPRPTDAQAVEAKDAVAAALRAEGDDISNYRVTTGRRIRSLGKEARSRHVLQLALLGGSRRHFYLVDVSSHQIVVHAEIESLLDAGYDEYGELVHLLGLRQN